MSPSLLAVHDPSRCDAGAVCSGVRPALSLSQWRDAVQSVRAANGLPTDADTVVIACFNRMEKVDPAAWHAWVCLVYG